MNAHIQFRDLAKPVVLSDLKETYYCIFQLPLNFRNPSNEREMLFDREVERWVPLFRLLMQTRKGQAAIERFIIKAVQESTRTSHPYIYQDFAGLKHLAIP